MSLTENSSQLFLPGGCNRTQNLRIGPYTISVSCTIKCQPEVGVVDVVENLNLFIYCIFFILGA